MRHHGATLAVCFLTLNILCPAPGWAATPMGATATPLLQSGPKGKKKNLVIIGDGFQAGDQAIFNNYVDQTVLAGTFGEGPLMESMNAFNITRINVNSTDSGVTQIETRTNQPFQADVFPDGILLNFTFSGANAVVPIPFLTGVSIVDPSGITVTDKNKAGALADENGVVSGTVSYTSGLVTLNYAAGHAPPRGNFNITYSFVSIPRSTPLDYRFSGNWSRCWMEGGPNTEANLKSILDALVPERNYTFVVLNEAQFGGCGGGGRLTVTLAGDWSLPAHESGHMIGGLCDEYHGQDDNYTGAEPGCVNITINTNRSTLKWRDFVDPATPIPTVYSSPPMDQTETAGAFEGGMTYYKTGVWRPHNNARMNSNNRAFGPVGYNRMKEVLASYHDHDFRQTYVGDFDGDGRADLVIHNANALELYLSNGTHELARWTQALPLGAWDYFAKNDQFLVGDFDGDGKDDLFVYNMVDFNQPYFGLLRSVSSPSSAPPVFGFTAVVRYDSELPGWGKMKQGDRFYVADFDGDGKSDLFVTNTNRTDWAVGYLGMLRSTGTGLEMVRRYDEMLPGWDKIMPKDKFFVANLDGQGGQDLFVFNVGDWKMGYLMSLISTGTELVPGVRYDRVVPGWDELRGGDQFFVADFDGDQNDDLYVFNGTDYSMPYLGVMRSTGAGALEVPVLHADSVPGWDKLKAHDRFFVANVGGLGRRRDLYVYNAWDWGNRQYLGALLAHPDGFQGWFQEDWIGGWNLGGNDVFYVANFDGQPGGAPPLDDLVVQNGASSGNKYLGLLHNDGGSLSSSAVYLNWIHHYLYYASGLW